MLLNLPEQRLLKEHQIFIIPAWQWETRGLKTGADFHEVREVLNNNKIDYRFIPTSSSQNVSMNSRMIKKWMDELDDRPVIIISGSKGSGEVYNTFDMGSVRGYQYFNGLETHWFNVSGLIRGTSLVDMYHLPVLGHLAKVISLFGKQSYAYDVLESMSNDAALNRSLTIDIPENVNVYNILTKLDEWRSEFWAYYPLLKWTQGDNDGLIALEDCIVQNAPTAIFKGQRHLFNGGEQAKHLIPFILKSIHKKA